MHQGQYRGIGNELGKPMREKGQKYETHKGGRGGNDSTKKELTEKRLKEKRLHKNKPLKFKQAVRRRGVI